MARRRRSRAQSLSLFPFLSVLAAVIGALVLLITALPLLSIADLSVPPEERYQSLRTWIAERQREISDLETLIHEAVAVRDQLAAARSELAALESPALERQRMRRQRADLLAQAHRLQERIEELQTELSRLLEAIAEAQSLLAERERLQNRIQLQPGGSGEISEIEPWFAECTENALLLHRQPGQEPTLVRQADVDTSSPLSEFFNEAKSDPDIIVIFLIRPDGVPLFDEVSFIARRRNVRHGKLPLPGHGEIDWGVFGRLQG